MDRAAVLARKARLKRLATRRGHSAGQPVMTIPLAGRNARAAAFATIGSDKYTQIIAVKVNTGDLRAWFVVHKYIIEKAPVLRTFLANDDVEAREGIIRLPEDDRTAFAQWFYYMYHDSLEDETLPDAWADFTDHQVGDRVAIEARTTVMVKLYAMAEKYGEEALQNEVVEALVRSLQYTLLTGHQVRLLCEGTADNAPLRAAVFQNMAMRSHELGRDWFLTTDVHRAYIKQDEDAANELLDATDAIHRQGGDVWPHTGDMHRWHTHYTTHECQ